MGILFVDPSVLFYYRVPTHTIFGGCISAIGEDSLCFPSPNVKFIERPPFSKLVKLYINLSSKRLINLCVQTFRRLLYPVPSLGIILQPAKLMNGIKRDCQTEIRSRLRIYNNCPLRGGGGGGGKLKLILIRCAEKTKHTLNRFFFAVFRPKII